LAADFSPASAQAAIYARSLALQHGANLTVLHVLEPSATAGGVDRTTVEFGVERKLHALLGNDAIPGCSVRMEIGKVVPTILRTAGEVHADLLILGVRSWSGVLDRFMWPHAYEVVREARCPVLTVRAAVATHKFS
jgi:nucleotide-binding universal stress UspA family protein